MKVCQKVHLTYLKENSKYIMTLTITRSMPGRRKVYHGIKKYDIKPKSASRSQKVWNVP